MTQRGEHGGHLYGIAWLDEKIRLAADPPSDNLC